MQGLQKEIGEKTSGFANEQKAGVMETCFFCAIQYHPMMRWAKVKQVTVTRGGDPVYAYVGLITVCNYVVCEDKARAKGLEKQRHLTPRR